MFQHLPCRKLRCSLLVNPLVIGSISLQQRTEAIIWNIYKLVTRFLCFLRLYYPFHSFSFLYCFAFPLDIFACLFPSYRSLSFYALFCLIHILSLFHLFFIYFFSIIEFKTVSHALISPFSWLTRFNYKTVLMHII